MANKGTEEAFFGEKIELSMLSLDGDIGIGNDTLGFHIAGDLDILTAEAALGFFFDQKIGAVACAQASVAKCDLVTRISLFGLDINIGVTGNALTAKAEAKAGYLGENGWGVKAGAGAGYWGLGAIIGIS